MGRLDEALVIGCTLMTNFSGGLSYIENRIYVLDDRSMVPHTGL
jgi:hypothetical protein